MWASLVMSVIAVQSVKMATAIVLLSVLFVSGAVAVCPEESALLITTPPEMKALSGSCLQIPCNFSRNINVQQTLDGTIPTFGVWIINSQEFATQPTNVIFNSSGMNNIYPMNLTGDLSQKNCTTLFSNLITSYTGKYFFRIENGPFRATASCHPLEITVNDSPPSPSIVISGDDLKEKQSVTITCSAFTPCPHSPPELTWTLQQDPHNKIEENTDRTFTTKLQTTFTLSDKHDGLNITCSARYPLNEGKDIKTAENRTLSVSYAPKNTSVSISPSGLVSVGSLVNLTCSSTANPPVIRFTWFKTSENRPVNVFEGDFYSLNVTDGGVYFCVATNELGNGTSPEIHLTMNGEVGSLELGPFIGGIIGFIALICLIVCVWRLKSTHATAQQTQSQTGEAAEEPASKTEEVLHYGEINFTTRPEPASVQDAGQQQDTLYAQVKVSQTANSLRQTADGPEDLYAQVKKN